MIIESWQQIVDILPYGVEAEGTHNAQILSDLREIESRRIETALRQFATQITQQGIGVTDHPHP